jgi:hypothetical protein
MSDTLNLRDYLTATKHADDVVSLSAPGCVISLTPQEIETLARWVTNAAHIQRHLAAADTEVGKRYACPDPAVVEPEWT